MMARHERTLGTVQQVKRAARALHDTHGPFDDQTIHGRLTVLARDGLPKIVQEAEHTPLLLHNRLLFLEHARDRLILFFRRVQQQDKHCHERQNEEDDQYSVHAWVPRDARVIFEQRRVRLSGGVPMA
jgi:hypothetical protein